MPHLLCEREWTWSPPAAKNFLYLLMGSGGQFAVYIMLKYTNLLSPDMCQNGQNALVAVALPEPLAGLMGERKGKERRKGRRKGENGKERMGGKEIAEV